VKNKLILPLAIATLIIFTFAGCRDLRSGSSTGSGAASSGTGLNSVVSGVVSSVESGGKALGSQVSGVVSAITSSK